LLILLATPVNNICFILPAMKFGERIEAALQEMQWGPKDLEQRTGVADSTISALTRRGSDRSNYKESIIKGFPAAKISHEWLRNGVGQMLADMEQSEAQAIQDAQHAKTSSMGMDLAVLFDQLPEDRALRAQVFVQCYQIIAPVVQRIGVTPSHTQDVHIHPRKLGV
jgi:hypothetical protein